MHDSPARPRDSRQIPGARFVRAWKALRTLLATPEATLKAVELIQELDPDGPRRRVARLSRTQAGRDLLDARPSLAAALTDRDALAALPEATFGRAYLRHIERYELDPLVLVRLRRMADPSWESRSEEERWLSERMVLAHDLWHVLTGLGADRYGESVLLTFSWAQQGGLGNAVLSISTSMRAVRMRGLAHLRVVAGAWRSGWRAQGLESAQYEELLALPLDTVRRQLRVVPLGGNDPSEPDGVGAGGAGLGAPQAMVSS